LAEDKKERSRIEDLVRAILGICAAGILISSPWNVDTSGPEPFYKGPLIFPIIALGIMVLASLPSIWRLLRSTAEVPWALGKYSIPYKTGLILLLLIAFLVAIPWLGLELSSLIFLGVSLKVLGYRSPIKGILLPLLMTALLWLVFKQLLGVFFPIPRLWELLMD